MNNPKYPPGWVYLRLNEEGEIIKEDREKLPPEGSGFLAFDTFRWKVQVGIREDIGCLSLLLPHVNDDCNVVAWAPIGTTEPPDENIIRANVPEPWQSAISEAYSNSGLSLLFAWNTQP